MKRTLILLGLAGLFATAPSARAQDFGLSISKSFGSARVTLGYGHSQLRAPSCSLRPGAVQARVRSVHPYASAPRRIWVAAHYETRQERTGVPGRRERVWNEPVYSHQRDSCGRLVRVLVRAGGWQTVFAPGRYETRSVNAWVPGYWQTVRRY